MALRRPTLPLILSPLPVGLFVLVHSVVVTPPDLTTTILHAVLESVGATVGLLAGALIGLMVPARTGRPGWLWWCGGAAAAALTFVIAAEAQWLLEAMTAEAYQLEPGQQLPLPPTRPLVVLGASAFPIAAWTAITAATHDFRR